MNTTQNINAGNNGALAQALHTANVEAIKKSSNKIVGVGEVPLIVPRQDLLGNKVLFLAETQDREASTVQYWDGKKGNKPATAPMAFYKSTKPIEDEAAKSKLITDFSKEFGYKEVILRQRLVKESVMRTPDPQKPGDEQASQKEFVDKIIAAMQKAAYQAIGINT